MCAFHGAHPAGVCRDNRVVKTHARINTPQGEGNIFPHVTQDDLQVGEIIKYTGTAQAQSVDRCFNRETPWGTHQPGMPLIIPGL